MYLYIENIQIVLMYHYQNMDHLVHKTILVHNQYNLDLFHYILYVNDLHDLENNLQLYHLLHMTIDMVYIYQLLDIYNQMVYLMLDLMDLLYLNILNNPIHHHLMDNLEWDYQLLKNHIQNQLEYIHHLQSN